MSILAFVNTIILWSVLRRQKRKIADSIYIFVCLV